MHTHTLHSITIPIAERNVFFPVVAFIFSLALSPNATACVRRMRAEQHSNCPRNIIVEITRKYRQTNTIIMDTEP